MTFRWRVRGEWLCRVWKIVRTSEKLLAMLLNIPTMLDHVGCRYFFSRFVGSQLYFSPFVASHLTTFSSIQTLVHASPFA